MKKELGPQHDDQSGTRSGQLEANILTGSLPDSLTITHCSVAGLKSIRALLYMGNGSNAAPENANGSGRGAGQLT